MCFQTIRDRIQKLEDILQASKKRLTQIKSGRPAVRLVLLHFIYYSEYVLTLHLRAPTLDTINRTYRNIDIAISQQSDDISHLATRMSKLKIRRPRDSPAPSSRESAGSEDSQFLAATAKVDKRSSVNVTPNIAVTTAAALNAERAAQRLKKALMNARKEPLLNKQAAEAVAAYEFKIPSKADLAQYIESATSPAFSLSNSTPGNSMETPKWSLPAFDVINTESPESPTPTHSHAHRLRESGKR